MKPEKVGAVLRRLRQDGWLLVTTVGSHRQLEHPTKPGKVTVHGKPSETLHVGTLLAIYRQAGWR